MPTMVRQARSEATRKRIIIAAVETFNEIGYASAGLGEIVERAQMTKGALYYHFNSKDSLAAAIIEEGSTSLFNAFHNISESPGPALEGMIHGTFVVVDLFNSDMVARSATQLLRALGEFNTTVADTYIGWLDEMSARATAALEEGDLRPNLDPRAVGDTIVAAMLGAELLSTSSGDNILHRVTRMWEVLLPAIVTDKSLPYFREFLARESLRRAAAMTE
jgi:AcrR family transcriptional regulator